MEFGIAILVRLIFSQALDTLSSAQPDQTREGQCQLHQARHQTGDQLVSREMESESIYRSRQSRKFYGLLITLEPYNHLHGRFGSPPLDSTVQLPSSIWISGYWDWTPPPPRLSRQDVRGCFGTILPPRSDSLTACYCLLSIVCYASWDPI